MASIPENPTDERSRKLRLCLKCDDPFESEWVGERICRRCKGSHSWRHGGVAAQ